MKSFCFVVLYTNLDYSISLLKITSDFYDLGSLKCGTILKECDAAKGLFNTEYISLTRDELSLLLRLNLDVYGGTFTNEIKIIDRLVLLGGMICWETPRKEKLL